ncbi:hypothetical protein FNV43_RR08069 [Rhamnella rubrinervis]|uniref:Two-component response regulator-like APRR1 n=1 Tax=Rhamnella rubrinervis TaxID=2594499 RepID=A0A8K0MNB1_9ROSA|nr:hypothetical protein FNV43_RR08069 [Rhamnella rubrinervis]
MASKELNLNKECQGGRVGGDRFIDRSKVRILLCDNDSESSKEVFTLLSSCSYQVVSVKSARQVIDALNAEGPDIDIILAEVDLPMTKGMKMLKYISRDKELRRIPVIMMSAQDEVSLVVECMRLGAADYLVKPLRINQLLNLWTHMWRRKRLICLHKSDNLGLAEKKFVNYDLDLVAPEPNDANTNSTALFSDDTYVESHKSTNLEMAMSVLQEDESTTAAAEPLLTNLVEYRPEVPGITDRRTGQFSCGPKKSELKIGESSAFLTYVKLSTIKNNSQAVAHFEVNSAQHLMVDASHQACGNQAVDDLQPQGNGEAKDSSSTADVLPSSTSFPDSISMERCCTPPALTRFQHENHLKEERFSQVLVHPRNGSQHNVSGLPTQVAYPYCVSGFINQVLMSTSAQVYQKNLHDIQNHATTSMIPQCPPRVSGMASFPCYPVGMCLQPPGQMPATHLWPWPSFGSPSGEVKLNRFYRREAALFKYRQKRKERCFDKKIRYVNRKRLAERRPRVRGQFIRKVNDLVDLNGQPSI